MTGFDDGNLKIPLILDILTFVSRINFKISCEHEKKSYITLWPEFVLVHTQIFEELRISQVKRYAEF